MWEIEATGYAPITTFWDEFSISDVFGADSVEKHYREVFELWKTDYKFMTELFLVLSYKCWDHYEKAEYILARKYDDLSGELEKYIYDTFTEEQLKYFFKTTN